MRRFLLAAAAPILLAGCGSDSTAPDVLNVAGTYIGDYTATLTPGLIYEGVLSLSQNGNSVSGTLTTSAGRAANVSGSVNGAQISLSGSYTDGCAGTVTSTASLSQNGTRLTGNYSASDCVGQYSGGYVLDKQ